MKKLMMLAAAMTIVGSAFAACELPAAGDCALVYDFKASLKTTKGGEGSCDACIRVKGTKALTGWIFVCACDCETFMSDAVLLAYDKKSGTVYTGPVVWGLLNKIGKKSVDAEGYWTSALTVDVDGAGAFAAAGFGTFDGLVLKSMSGDLVGTIPAPACEVKCDLGTVASALPACTFEFDPENPPATIVYGSWSMKYDKKMSAAYAAGTWVPGMDK